MSETNHAKFGEARQKELDRVLRKLASSRKVAIEAELDLPKSRIRNEVKYGQILQIHSD